MLLDFNQAKQAILQHAGHIVLDQRSSLVGSLRPYSGLREEDFKEVILALVSLHTELSERDLLDRELVYGCWDLCSRMDILVLRENSLLRSNRLIRHEDLIRVREWHHSVDSFCRRCFHKLDLGTCMSTFIEYLGSEACPSPKIYQDFTYVLESLASGADFELTPLLERALQVIQGT